MSIPNFDGFNVPLWIIISTFITKQPKFIHDDLLNILNLAVSNCISIKIYKVRHHVTLPSWLNNVTLNQ